MEEPLRLPGLNIRGIEAGPELSWVLSSLGWLTGTIGVLAGPAGRSKGVRGG